MGLFDIFNRLDTKTNNGLNLIHDKKTKNLLYAFNKKNGRIDGLVQVFYSVGSSGHNPNYKLTNVGFVRQEYLFIDGFPNGYFKEFDSKGNLSYHIDNIKSNTFNFILNFSLNFLKPRLLFSDKYQINGFVNEYYPNGILSKELKVVENKLNSSKSYYQNGQLNYDSIESKEYYDNGQLKKNLKSGEEYYENGQLKKDLKTGEEYYKNGQLKFDILRGKEYYENGTIKIDNDCGAKYLISESLNPVYFKDNNSFDKFLKKDTIINDNKFYNYYKNILIYNEEGELINIEQIINLYDQEDYFLRASRLRKSFREMGGHISITSKPYLDTKCSEPILINNYCFSVCVKFYGDPFLKINLDTTTHLSPYTGWYNNISYDKGINLNNFNFQDHEKKSKLKINKTQNAVEFYEKGIEKDANSDYEGAIIDFTKAIEIDVEYIDAYRGRAYAKWFLRDYEGAISDYTKILDFNPEDIDAYESRGRSKASLKDYNGAIGDFDKVIELDIESGVYSYRGRMKKNLLDFNGALLDYNIAVEKYPEDDSGVFGRGELKYEIADYHGAIKDFDKCIEIKPNRIMSFHKRGDCKLKIEDFKGAIEDYSIVVQNRQDKYGVDRPPSENASKLLASLYHNRGIARSKINKYTDAIKDFHKAVELNPNCIDEVNKDLELTIKQQG
jgi:tetratricopeptide (TPR) repeat protein